MLCQWWRERLKFPLQRNNEAGISSISFLKTYERLYQIHNGLQKRKWQYGMQHYQRLSEGITNKEKKCWVPPCVLCSINLKYTYMYFFLLFFNSCGKLEITTTAVPGQWTSETLRFGNKQVDENQIAIAKRLWNWCYSVWLRTNPRKVTFIILSW